jgi:hypothetical protein
MKKKQTQKQAQNGLPGSSAANQKIGVRPRTRAMPPTPHIRQNNQEKRFTI